MNPMRQMAEAASQRKLAMQHCFACGAVQYPPRELCATCLSDTLDWHVRDSAEGQVLASAELQHSHESAFRDRLPLQIGLVLLDAGPTVVCFLTDCCSAGTRVSVTAYLDSEERAVLSARAVITPDANPPRAAAAAQSR